MGAAFLKHIQQVHAHATAVKLLKDALPKAHKEKFHYYEKFRFEHDEKTLPLLVLGEISKEHLELLKSGNSGAAAEGVCHVVDKKNVYFACVGGRMSQTQLEAAVKQTNFPGEVIAGKPPKPESKKQDDDGEKEKEREDEEERVEAEEPPAAGKRVYGRPPGGPNAAPKRIKDEDRTKEGDVLPSKSIGEEYQGEDVKTGWRAAQIKGANPESDAHTTKYFRGAEREPNKVKVEDGLLARKSGGAIGGRNAFAIDPKTGEMHAKEFARPKNLDGGKKQYEHHSSFLAGEDAAAAGHIRTDDGFLSEMDDDSGHLKPDSGLTRAAVQHLRDVQKAKLIDDRLETGDGGRPSEGNEKDEVEAARKAKEEAADALAEERLKLFRNESIRMEREIRDGAKKNPKLLVVAEQLDKLDDALADATKKEDVDEVRRLTEERRKLLVAKSSGISEQGKKEAKRLADEILALKVAADQEGAPAQRETKITMQGKTGLSQEEYDSADGSRVKLNALIEKKCGLKNFTTNLRDATINSRPSLNKKIGEALKLSVPASEFLAADGDETNLRDRRGAASVIERMGEVDPKGEGGRTAKIKQAEDELARMDDAGFVKELANFGIDLGPQGMPVPMQLQVFRGVVSKEEARRKWPSDRGLELMLDECDEEGFVSPRAPKDVKLQLVRGEIALEEVVRDHPSTKAVNATKRRLNAAGFTMEGPFKVPDEVLRRFHRNEMDLDEVGAICPRIDELDSVRESLQGGGVYFGRGGMPDSALLDVYYGRLTPGEALERWPEPSSTEEAGPSGGGAGEKEPPAPRRRGPVRPAASDDDEEDEKESGGDYEVVDDGSPAADEESEESDEDEGEKEKETPRRAARDEAPSPRAGVRGRSDETEEEEKGTDYEAVETPVSN